MRNRSVVRATFATLLLGLVAVLGHAQAPVPFVSQPLVPDAMAPGGPDFTLTVNGTGFVSGSVVNWNGSPLATTFISGSELSASVPAADIVTATTGWVTVVNPAPGGGTSNVAFVTVTRNTGNSVAFGSASYQATGNNPFSVAVGDFNGDGKLDLAAANYSGNTVSILLGDGRGNFTLASSPSAGNHPWSVAVGDFNGDGVPDLAVADYNSNGKLAILLGDGKGHFTHASSPAVGSLPTSVAVGDFNGDGRLDLAVTNLSSYTVSILLGDGTGNFTLASSPATGKAPQSVAVGDFNGDGKLDLAVVNYDSNTVSILLGDGTGNFTLASSPATGNLPWPVAVGDFNGDGILDLAVGNYGDGTVSILLGDGTGNFTLASTVAEGNFYCSPESVALGDFTGNGELDLAVANEYCNGVSILLGDGTGNFTLTSSLGGFANPNSVALGDFNADGRLDLAATNTSGSTVSIVLQVPPEPVVTLSPTSLSFGPQLVGTTSSAQIVTLNNTGDSALNIISVLASTNFSQTNTCGSSVAAGASCTISVTFVPRGPGTLPGSITITDNASNSPQTVSLTGVGTEVTLSPGTLNFNTQPVGTTSAAQTVSLTNNGYQPLSIAGIHFTGADPADFAETNTCGSSVAAGASCTFSITFTPQAVGRRSSTMGVADNGGGSPQKVTLSGTGTSQQ